MVMSKKVIIIIIKDCQQICQTASVLLSLFPALCFRPLQISKEHFSTHIGTAAVLIVPKTADAQQLKPNLLRNYFCFFTILNCKGFPHKTQELHLL